MADKYLSRRDFLKTNAAATLGLALVSSASPDMPVVSVVKIKNDKIEYAIDKAIDLLGGIKDVTKGKNSILLKPNVVPWTALINSGGCRRFEFTVTAWAIPNKVLDAAFGRSQKHSNRRGHRDRRDNK